MVRLSTLTLTLKHFMVGWMFLGFCYFYKVKIYTFIILLSLIEISVTCLKFNKIKARKQSPRSCDPCCVAKASEEVTLKITALFLGLTSSQQRHIMSHQKWRSSKARPV